MIASSSEPSDLQESTKGQGGGRVPASRPDREVDMLDLEPWTEFSGSLASVAWDQNMLSVKAGEQVRGVPLSRLKPEAIGKLHEASPGQRIRILAADRGARWRVVLP